MDDLGAAQFLARSVYRSFSTVSQTSRDSDRISWERLRMPEPSRLPSLVPGDKEDKSMRWNNIKLKTIMITYLYRVAFLVNGTPSFRVVSEDTPIKTVIQVKYTFNSIAKPSHYSTPASKELLETSRMKGEAEDYALIYQVAEMVSFKVSEFCRMSREISKSCYISLFSQIDGKTVKQYRVVTEKDRLASI